MTPAVTLTAPIPACPVRGDGRLVWVSEPGRAFAVLASCPACRHGVAVGLPTRGWHMTEQRCEDTCLLVTQCACPEHRGGQEVADELKTVGQPFTAQYDGCCAACERPIRPGQLIARLADDVAYVHAGRCPR